MLGPIIWVGFEEEILKINFEDFGPILTRKMESKVEWLPYDLPDVFLCLGAQ